MIPWGVWDKKQGQDEVAGWALALSINEPMEGSCSKASCAPLFLSTAEHLHCTQERKASPWDLASGGSWPSTPGSWWGCPHTVPLHVAAGLSNFFQDHLASQGVCYFFELLQIKWPEPSRNELVAQPCSENFNMSLLLFLCSLLQQITTQWLLGSVDLNKDDGRWVETASPKLSLTLWEDSRIDPGQVGSSG